MSKQEHPKLSDEQVNQAARLLIIGVAKSRKVKQALMVTFAVIFSFICYFFFSELMIGRMNSAHLAEAAQNCEAKGKYAFSALSIGKDGSTGDFYVICIDKADVHTDSVGLNTLLKKPGAGLGD